MCVIYLRIPFSNFGESNFRMFAFNLLCSNRKNRLYLLDYWYFILDIHEFGVYFGCFTGISTSYIGINKLL